ncbi:MAG: hypothetical protein U0441_28500 [Polyangiaceae bacterium]
MPPVQPPSQPQRAHTALAITAVFLFALAAGCDKPAPACVKLKSCCDALLAEPAAYGTTDASRACVTYVAVYPKNPATGEVPGQAFCESVASDFPTALAKASKPPPEACK